MTRPPTHASVSACGRRRAWGRRVWERPAWSRPLALTVALGVLAVPAAAHADAVVVSATVFTGTAGAADTESVALSTLQACPAYTGPTALTVYPGGLTDTLPASSTWTVSEILACGLQIPASDVTQLQVLRPDGAAEQPLTGAQLSDPSRYADPAAPGALPVISNDGGAEQNTYTRPWRGGSDQNGSDQVTDNGAIPLLVYENTTPLVVSIASRTVTRRDGSERVALSARTRTSNGTPVSSASLAYTWTISTGASSTSATPTVTIPQGSATVTVQVADTAAGTGGTDSTTLTYRPRTAGGATHGGGGTGTYGRTGGSAPSHHHGGHGGGRAGTGAPTTTTRSTTTTTRSTPTTHSTPTTAPVVGGGPPATSSTTTTTAPPRTSTTVTETTTQTATAPATTQTHSTRTQPARPRPVHRTPHRASPHRTRGALVSGRLVGALSSDSAGGPPEPTPAPTGAGAAAVSAPDAAGRFTVPGAIAGGLVALALLGLGAIREARARSFRLHR